MVAPVLFDSLQRLGAAQGVRRITAPTQLAAPAPAREALLEPFRQRNAALDWLFYDLGVVTGAEAARLAPRYAAEGSVLRVAPEPGGGLELWPDAPTFLRAGRSQARTIAVAGVGSSALGAAAFARNVAQARGEPVLAVVSGYGLADLAVEAVGGFLLFGQLNSLRHAFEPLDDRLTGRSTSSATQAIVRRSLDVRTLVLLLSEFPVDLLVGHSKGNLVISEALFALRDARRPRHDALAASARIITVSARIGMPGAWKGRVTDVMGALDGFGLMNSRVSIPTDVRVPGAWHHTNTDLPLHLPVARVLAPLVA